MKAPFTRVGRAALCLTVLLLAPSAGQAALLMPGTTVVPDILADVPVAVEASVLQGLVSDNFSGIAPGETSPILVIRTNATTFSNGVSTVSDDINLAENTFDAVGTFQPAAAAIPEPASLVLLSSAFAAAGYVARHRARKRKPGSA
jgi:hypothetical protein